MQSQSRARNPDKNGIVELLVKSVRDVPLEVQHSPDEERNNRAHTDVIGEKNTKVRFKLLDIYKWVIQIQE